MRGGLGNDAVGGADAASGEPPLADGLRLGLRASILRGDLDWRLLGGGESDGEGIHLSYDLEKARERCYEWLFMVFGE